MSTPKTFASLDDRFAPSRALDPSLGQAEEWMQELRRVTLDFLGRRSSLPAYSQPRSAPVVARDFGEEPRELGGLLDEVLGLLEGGVGTASGGFFGYVPGGGLPTAALGDFLAALVNPYAGMHGASPGAVAIENRCVRFLVDLFELPSEAWGTLTSGGSLATVTALATAREDRCHRDRPARDHVVYGTTQAHHCQSRALRLIGMGDAVRRAVAVDARLRMKPDELRRALREDREQGRQPWLLFATAGTTNTGAVDPLEELGALAREEGLWFHVDGAYGGLFQLTQEGKGKLRGIDAADSIVIDPHKAFFLPYGVGACLVRDGHKLRATFLEEADYLADVQGDLEKSPTDYSPELTRHFRGMRVWLSLQTHGLGRMRNALEEKLELAKRFSDFVRTTPDLVLLDDPQLSVVVFHHAKGDGATRALLESLLARGKVHVSSTVIDGRFCLRACILSFRSHAEQLALLQSEVLTVLRS